MKDFKKSWLTIFIIIFLVILIFSLPKLLNLFFNNYKGSQLSASVSYPKICLYACPPPSPAVLTQPPGQPFSIPVIVDTDTSNIVGADIIINFDKNYLTLTDITPSGAISTSLKTFTPVVPNDPTGAFDKTTVISDANNNGSIKFGAAAAAWSNSGPTPTITLTSSFSGSSTLAILTFQPKQLGSTALTFDYTPNSTTDTNLVSPQNTDILSVINNLNITIANPTPTLTPTPQFCPFHSSGDFNCDNIINIFDYNILLQNFGCPTRTSPVCDPDWNSADANNDGLINIFDYNTLLQHFGQSVTPTP